MAITHNYIEPSNAQALEMSLNEVCMYLDHPDCKQSDRIKLAEKLRSLATQVGELAPDDLVNYYHFSLEDFTADNREELNNLYDSYVISEQSINESYKSLNEFISDVYYTTNRDANMFGDLVWKVELSN